ncbi:hypothetical protein JVU11DRAFT_2186 [Chiua virens]|nr:hypothetical protein JVU11DRAFT_2186 [Chiua virens]
MINEALPCLYPVDSPSLSSLPSSHPLRSSLLSHPTEFSIKMSFSSRLKASENAHGRGRVLRDNQESNASTIPRQTFENTLDATIQIIQQITQLIPIQTAKNVLIGITSILLLLQKNTKNKDGLTSLARRCDAICSTLARATEDVSTEDISDVLTDALRTLESSIDELHSSVDKAMQRGRIRRLVGATLDEKQINEWTRELDSTLILFSAGVNIVSGIRSEQTYRLLKHREGQSLRPELPPAPPAMFFGREDLFTKVKSALLRDEDVVLIGTGGIGKSTIAKALIHDEDIRRRYARRFFITYEGMDPLTITSGSFVDRIACALGLPMRGSHNKHTIVSNLASSTVLMVLDNAETFEDAANQDVTEQISSIVSEIANTQGVTVILTSRTSRNARNTRWTEFYVPALRKAPAREYFRTIYHGDITDEDIDELLGTLDFHPLSIHILAHTARESGWTGEELRDEWQAQRSRLLQKGHKKENLGFTVQLSLNSPSVKDLGDNAVNVLRVIAFFPQGINRKHATRLFPTIPDILSLMDTLYKVSLVYRSGTFLSTLAPIRLFLLDVFSPPGLDLLADIRQTYYDSLWEVSETKDSHAELIISDHLNIEYLIAHDIAHGPDNTQDATLACHRFLFGLRQHKVRPTSLALMIPPLPEASYDEKQSKAWCLEALGMLYSGLSGYARVRAACSAAFTLFVDIGDHIMAARCLSNTAMSDNNLGFYSRAQRLLEDFICSPSWNYADEEKPEIHFTLDWSKMYTSRESADKLFLLSMDDPFRGPQSHVRHWQARMYHGYNRPEEVEGHLESIRSLCMTSSNIWDHWRFLQAAAEAAFLQQRFDTAMDFLNQASDAASGDSDFLLTLIILKHQAAVASVQGNYEHSRSLLQHAIDTLSVVSTPSSSDFLYIRYVHGRNELYARNYSEARRLLSDVIIDSDIHGNLAVKLRSTRALGEAELLFGCKTNSDRSFGQTVELCREAGISPESLHIIEPMMLNLDDGEFPGWKNFLRGQTV